MRYFIILITLFLMAGCSAKPNYKKDVLKADLKEKLNDSNNQILKKTVIEIIEVNAENFTIVSNSIPNNVNIKKIKIFGAPLTDVIALLMEATDENVVLQLQSNAILGATSSGGTGLGTIGVNGIGTNNTTGTGRTGSYGGLGGFDSGDMASSDIYVSASDISFGRFLRKTVGDKISIRYEDGTYYFGAYKTVTIKIPSVNGLADELIKTLRILGATNVVNDAITSSLTFSTREKEYIDIMKYLKLLRDNLYVIEYDISIYDVELKDEYKQGIDWNFLYTGSDFSLNAGTVTNIGATSSPAGVMSGIFSSGDLSGSMIANALEQFGKVESVQRPKLIGLAGTDVTFVDGLEEPYIESLSTTAVGDNGVQTSTVAATALSGLSVTLNSNIMDETVITDIELKINDIVGYTSFNVGETTYNQPKVHTKDIKNTMRVQPGVPIVISGLFRQKKDNGYKGLPGLAESSVRLLGGTEYETSIKTEMVIIVTPRVIKYVMK